MKVALRRQRAQAFPQFGLERIGLRAQLSGEEVDCEKARPTISSSLMGWRMVTLKPVQLGEGGAKQKRLIAAMAQRLALRDMRLLARGRYLSPTLHRILNQAFSGSTGWASWKKATRAAGATIRSSMASVAIAVHPVKGAPDGHQANGPMSGVRS